MTERKDVTVMGKVTSVYGVKGWVKVLSYTRPMENLCEYRHWVLQKDKDAKSVQVSDCKRHGNGLIAKLVGCDDREVAKELGGYLISVPTKDLPDLEQGDYYWHQLVGLKVSTMDGKPLGRISR